MYIKSQIFLVLGISKSGFSATEYLLKQKATCYIVEEHINEKIKASVSSLTEKGAISVDVKSALEILSSIDVLVISPGVAINHPLCVKAKSLGKKIIGELEFAYLQFMPTFIGVTGTNGKTTTVSMIAYILSLAEKKNQMVGNIGIPLSQKLSEITSDTICVAEVSSFQLESMDKFCPHIACVLNIAPDHLERHYTMENYIFLKKRILSNLTRSEYAVLNNDDEIVKDFVNETKCNVFFVSLKEKVRGAYLNEGTLYYNDEAIIETKNLAMLGEHNIMNALFSICVCKILGINNSIIEKGLAEFKGVKHRVEKVAVKDGITYFNDSKSTNAQATISALKSMTSPTILILGGSDKGEDFGKLFEFIKQSNVKQVILTGAVRFKLLNSAIKSSYYRITLTENFYDAVKMSKLFAEEGDNILLSPACASFDAFDNFEQRGERFIEIVKEL